MLISYITALLPLAAMWLVFRRCFAQTRMLLYAEIDQVTPARRGDYLRVKSERYAVSQHFEGL